MGGAPIAQFRLVGSAGSGWVGAAGLLAHWLRDRDLELDGPGDLVRKRAW